MTVRVLVHGGRRRMQNRQTFLIRPLTRNAEGSVERLPSPRVRRCDDPREDDTGNEVVPGVVELFSVLPLGARSVTSRYT